MADKRKMEVIITAKDKTKAGTKSAETNFKKIASAAKGAAIAGAAAGAALGVAITAKSLKLWAIQEKAIIQVEKRLKSTGASAWTSSEQLQTMAASLQRVTTFGDETILQMQQLLLSFKSIRGPEFEGATKAILDMASALAQSSGGEPDLRSAATMVGKALDDPIAGITALTRAGVKFNPEQKKLISGLVETGNQAKAQAIILRELESQFGGASGPEGLAGAARQAQNAFYDLFEEFGRGLTGATNLETSMRSLTDYMGSQQTQDSIRGIGRAIGWSAEKFIGFGQGIGEVAAALTTLSTATGDWRGAGIPEPTGPSLAVTTPSSSATFPGISMPSGLAEPGGMSLAGVGRVLDPGEGLAGFDMDAWYGDQSDASEVFWEQEKERIDAMWSHREEVEAEVTELYGLEQDARTAAMEMFYYAEDELIEESIAQSVRAAKKKEQIARQHTDIMLSFANNLGRAIAAGSDKTNRKSFERDKQMNIGLAVVNTAVGATRAYKDYGWPWGVAAAAAVVAAGAAQINTIKSQRFDGGDSALSVAAATDINTLDQAVSQPVTQPTTQRQTGPTYRIQVINSTIVDRSLDQFARELITPMEQAREDGVEAQTV